LNSNEQPLNYSAQVLDKAIEQGQVVFVNMTADWCITCKVNEKTSISSQAVQDILKQKTVTYIKGDWTHSDPAITQYLQRFKREGVPLYVVYRPGEKPQVLQQLLTPASLVKALQI
jgi:thiol:disulfide interchange protein